MKNILKSLNSNLPIFAGIPLAKLAGLPLLAGIVVFVILQALQPYPLPQQSVKIFFQDQGATYLRWSIYIFTCAGVAGFWQVWTFRLRRSMNLLVITILAGLIIFGGWELCLYFRVHNDFGNYLKALVEYQKLHPDFHFQMP